MNKNELIAAVAEKSALSKKDAEKAVSAFVSTVPRSRQGDSSARRLAHLS